MFAIDDRFPKLLPVAVSLGLHGAVAAFVMVYATHLTPPPAPTGITVTIDALSTAIAPGAEVPPAAAPAGVPAAETVPEAAAALPEQAGTTEPPAELTPPPAEIATARPEAVAPAEIPPQAASAPDTGDAAPASAPAAAVASAPAALDTATPAATISSDAPAEAMAATALPADAAPAVREAKAALAPAPVDDTAPSAIVSADPGEQPRAPQASPAGEQVSIAPATAPVAAAASTPPILEAPPALAATAEVGEAPSSIDQPLAKTTPPAPTKFEALPISEAPPASAPAIEALSPPSAPARVASGPIPAEAKPSAPSTAPSATVVPSAPSTTLDDTPDAQPPSAPPAQVAKLETGPSAAAIEAFVAHYDGGPCFYASVTHTSENGTSIDVLAADKPKFQTLNDAFVAKFGLDPDVLGQRVTPPQCPAVEMLRRSRPDNALVLRVDRNRVGGNEPVVGSVENPRNLPMSLYLVDETGQPVDVTKYISSVEGRIQFSVPVINSGRRGLVPILLVAVAGDTAPKLVEILDGNLDPSRFAMAGKMVLAGGR